MAPPRPPPDDDLRITTARLSLTPLVAADAGDLFPVLDDTRLHEFIGGRPATLEELRQRFARWQVRVAPEGRQIWLNWVVRLRASGAAIGYVQATVDDDRASIAYVIGSAWGEQGLATEAVRAMCGALRQQLAIRHLDAHVHPRHAASAAVARHAGLIRTDEVDEHGEEVWAVRIG